MGMTTKAIIPAAIAAALTHARRVLAALAIALPVLGGGQTLAVVPATLTTFDFSGACDDCAGAYVNYFGAPTDFYHARGDNVFQNVTATLVLANFVPGNALTAANFVSFTYNGSSLLQPFTVTAGVTLLSGRLAADGTILSPIDLVWTPPGGALASTLPGVDLPCGVCDFFVLTDGHWYLGIPANDLGVNGAFAVPEPATLAILGGVLLALGARRRPRHDV